MKRIRIGKDIKIVWKILTNLKPLSLEEKDIRLVLTTPLGRKSDLPFHVSNDIVHSSYPGILQKETGVYKLTLWVNYGKPGQSVVDNSMAFKIVSSTCQEPEQDINPEETVTACGNLIVGVTGDSAYEIAVRNGFVGSEKEWLESLKGGTTSIIPSFKLKDNMELEAAYPNSDNTDVERVVIGKVAVTPKGEYEEDEIYNILDIVGKDGCSYISKKSANTDPPENDESWLCIAKKGDSIKYEDLTPEQLEELQKPATKSAEALSDLGKRLKVLVWELEELEQISKLRDYVYSVNEDDIEIEDGYFTKKKIKFADRKYDPSTYSGKGYKILRKNIVGYTVKLEFEIESGCTNNGTITVSVNGISYDIEITSDSITPESVAQLISSSIPGSTLEGNVITFNGETSISFSTTGIKGKVTNRYISEKNVLTQEMMNEANTIYEIRYDFDLNEKEITIPKGCVLKFEGGSIINGIVDFNNTKILNVNFKDVFFSGHILGNCIANEFGCDNTGTVDNSYLINNLLKISDNIHFKEGIYLISDKIVLDNNQIIYVHENTTIKKHGDNLNPAIHLYSTGSGIIGSSRYTSTIACEDDSPYGIVSIGFSDENDMTSKNILNCIVNNINIVGKARGGNSSGNICFCLYLCNPFTSVYAASYFHVISNVSCKNANVGIGLLGDANANQISNIYFEQIGNDENLGGAGILLKNIIYNDNKRYPVENAINNIFHHTSPSATTLCIDSDSIYNSFLNIISEQGGNARWLRANNTNIKYNIFQGISNTSLGWSVWDGFFLNNTVLNTNTIKTKNVTADTLDIKNKITTKELSVKNIDKLIINNSTKIVNFTINNLYENTIYKAFSLTIPYNNITTSLIIKFKAITKNNNSLSTIILSYIDATYLITRSENNKISIRQFNGISSNQPLPIVKDNIIHFIFKTGNNGTFTKNTADIEYNIFSFSDDNYEIETYNEPKPISEDTITNFLGGTSQYITSLSTSELNKDIYKGALSIGQIIYDNIKNVPVWWNGTRFVYSDGFYSDNFRAGSTLYRPTEGIVTGTVFFDKSLNRPVWWNGEKWVDATGADS